MSNFCETCDRSFGSVEAFLQHLRDSIVHKPAFDCASCNRSFGSDESLQQHLRDSIVHNRPFDRETYDTSFETLLQLLRDSIVRKPTFDCKTCDKCFSSDEALQQHLRDSIVHKLTFRHETRNLPQPRRDSIVHESAFDCKTCNKSFGSNEALQQHLRDSIVHKPTFDCKTCNKCFGSEEAFQQHLQNSREHRPSFDCDTCARSFGTIDALDQHIQTSPVHSRPPIWCDTCERSFRSDEALQQHLQSSRIHQIEGQYHDIETETKLFEMFPELHQNVLGATSGAMNSPTFNYDDDDDSFDRANKEYSTNIMGDFTCNNHHRALSWPSKRVAIVIRGYPGNKYNAAVYYQRCKSCNELGTLDLDENSYVERVAYRLKKWAGVAVVEPPYDEKTGPPHISDLCEGCKAGFCQNDTGESEFERWD